MIEWNIILSAVVAGLLLWAIIWQSAQVGALNDRTQELRDEIDDTNVVTINLQGGHRDLRGDLGEIRDLLGPSWTDVHGNVRPIKMMAESHIRNCLEGGFVKSKETRDAMWKELAYREESRRWAKVTKINDNIKREAAVYDEACKVDFKAVDKIFGNPKGPSQEHLLNLVEVFQIKAIAYGCRMGGDTQQPAYLELCRARKELIDAIKEIAR